MSKDFEALWPLPCPEVVIVSGPFGCGKSTFALDTGAHPSRTYVVDFEKSQKAFAAQLPIEYVDVQSRMAKAYPQGYTSLQLYNQIVKHLDGLEADKYDVLILDNASPFEDALLSYVQANSKEFGHTPAQYQKMSGLMWGDVKSKYAQLLTRWVSKVHMIIIIVHLRNKYANNKIVLDPFGNPVQEPKGKDTLDQLASLFVQLEHGPGGVPAANVLKCRIDRKVWVEDPNNPPDGVPPYYLEGRTNPGIVTLPILPLRLPQCTWSSIRHYMEHPADLASPGPGEVPPKHVLTEDDRLKLRAIIALGEREADVKGTT